VRRSVRVSEVLLRLHLRLLERGSLAELQLDTGVREQAVGDSGPPYLR
jgi:hypothetical protein